MAILSYQISGAGLQNAEPSFLFLNTNNTQAEVLATGFLSLHTELASQLSTNMIAFVSTVDATVQSTSVFKLGYAAGAWSLLPVVDAGDIADGSITTAKLADSAVTAAKLAADAVTTAKILNANVTLAKLAAGIAPSHVVKYAGNSAQAGGSATVTLTVTGVAGTDVAFAQLSASANAVAVQKVTATTNTITILCSGDPGACTVGYQVLRAAS